MDRQQEKKFEVVVGLYELLGEEHLPMIRMGALLCHARPELGRFLVEATAPEVPTDSSDELKDVAMRLVSSDDNLLQGLIDLLTDAQEYMKEG